jgi:hypothetical protein
MLLTALIAWGAIAYKAESSTNALIITHNFCRCDIPKCVKACPKSIVINFVMNVFYVDIRSLLQKNKCANGNMCWMYKIEQTDE